MEVRDFINSGFVLLDGAMGTMLQRGGLPLGGRPELLSITHPAQITEIHRAYLQSGAQILYTNTFGANAHKLAGTGVTVEEVISAAVAAAKAAAAGTNCKIALDVGPLGELLEPAGSLTFEEAYELFRQQVVQGERCGADLIVLETMTDLYEAKAALLAAKENTALPVLCTMTFEPNGRTFTGCSISAMALTLEGLGADAIGLNCSLAPDEIYPMAKELCAWTRLPVIVKPNAGLPDPDSGAYSVSPARFAEQLRPFVALGVTIFGGCCGTDPAYIAAIKQMLATEAEQRSVRKAPAGGVCTPTKTVTLDEVRVIGERINPTGKKLFKQALLDGNFDYILAQGVLQAEAGADILDVNVGLPGIDERATMVRTVKLLQGVVEAPLQLDSSNPVVLEAALRVYNGKAVVNSVNGEQKSLDSILPLVKKYGAAIVGLTMDENGIPETAQARFAIAQRILNAALAYGIPKEDVYIDCLTLTASVQQEQVEETLKAVRRVTEELGLHTVLGVSNISFGLPNRELMNHSFLLLALSHGLTLPILNPNIATMMDAVRAYNVLANRDHAAKAYIASYGNTVAAPAAPAAPVTELAHAVAKGLCAQAKSIAAELLQAIDPLELVNTQLIPALDTVGTRFERGEIFLPQLLQAAQAAQAAFEVVREAVARQGSPSVSKGKIVLATVKGDIHDIGKNIVKVILENYGYQVLDLGRDVPVEKIIDTIREQQVHLAGLSALMTTTLPSMEQTIAAVHEAGLPCKIFVGGAVLTGDYAKKIGADFYTKDAKQAVDVAKQILG